VDPAALQHRHSPPCKSNCAYLSGDQVVALGDQLLEIKMMVTYGSELAPWLHVSAKAGVQGAILGARRPKRLRMRRHADVREQPHPGSETPNLNQAGRMVEAYGLEVSASASGI
jgi:hypothetical protein